MKTPDHHFNHATAAARFDAWWQGGLVDRPPVSLWVENPPSPQAPRSTHATLRERWLDVDFQVESAFAYLEANPCLGDTVPAWMPNAGSDLTSTLFGAELLFGEDTSWCQRHVNTTADWEHFIAMDPNFNNEYWRTVEAMIERAVERFDGRYYVAMPDLHGSFDMLAGIRGPENLCLDIVDEPELVRRASLHASRGYVTAFQRLHHRLTELGQPSTTWCNFLHDGPAYVPSCDFWCLVSRPVADDLIRPTLELEMTPMERSIFHLDGPQALHHLDLMLALPGLNAVQWVYGDGHGAAARWIETYRQIRQAGKAIQVLAKDAADALTVLRELGPEGMWISVGQPFANQALACEFLDAVEAA